MRVIAINKFEYANKVRQAGEEFEIESESDAKILSLAKQIVVKPSAVPPMTTENAAPLTPSKTETRAMKAEEEPTAKPGSLPEKRKRYLRRDMRAEE